MRAALAAILLAGCQPGEEGRLDPVEAASVARQTDEHGRPVAVLRYGPVVARVSGSWGDMRPQTVSIAYRNTGPAPVTVAIDRIAFRLGDAAAGLGYATDLTDMDVNATDPARAMPRALIGGEGADRKTVEIAPGQTRTLLFEFGFADPQRDPTAGDQVSVDVPTSGAPVRVVFRCKSSSLWPF